ncbi:MAG: acetyl-CoA carboxylase carboxyltransferase subunit alpha [candidate division NC10 bacterium]|nr:acetyl-CoA carboxylase carboxyltransferase subunit alpha [candidate division NC10 bacterium]MBI2163819.1 acetyl-CoA carboxylase carboxyltransferase subunit alpha [candidate division NC10 bacterium]MBI2562163.1 acetyl-CoA carboxylase carboxyltransferase subunit alpha [candidate division NC10 bacterium]
MPTYTLEFEKPILELETKIQELKQFAQVEHVDFSAEIVRLEKKVARLQEEVFANLTAWQRTQIARHPNRPYALDYIRLMLTDFIELHGDRGFADDRAIVGGLARLDGMGLVVIGHQKGRDTKEKLARNFAMANPEGYRKALRLMRLAEKFGKPVLTLVDTPGAYPGIGAEERGQAEAIARNLREMSDLKVPIVVVISGEGGSGGALGIAVGDTVLMLEYAIYSVISPEGCASILWRDPAKAPEAAAAMGITAQTLKRLAVIDEIVPEPVGGAHRNHQEMATTLQGVLVKAFDRLRRAPLDELLEQRYQKFRRMGVFEEG